MTSITLKMVENAILMCGFVSIWLSHWVPLIFIGRFLTGYANGSNKSSILPYTSEICQPRLRKFTGTLFVTSYTTGYAFMYIFGQTNCGVSSYLYLFHLIWNYWDPCPHIFYTQFLGIYRHCTVSNDKAAMRFFYAWFELSLYIFLRTQNFYHMTRQRRWKVGKSVGE